MSFLLGRSFAFHRIAAIGRRAGQPARPCARLGAHHRVTGFLLRRIGVVAAALATAALAGGSWAQNVLPTSPATAPTTVLETGLQPGEAFVTRFSGTTLVTRPNGQIDFAIDQEGTVGSIIDVRAPGRVPVGSHWINEPQRNPVTAKQVGQIFGVVLDDATPPNIYVSATAAFGLHLTPGTRNWMIGMWGQGGGPGTIYKLDAANNYSPSVFANVTLNNRQNTGAALGNMSFDRVSRQIFVSDLETGMIHRISIVDGKDLGSYDHGAQGRANFTDAASGEKKTLAPISFQPNSRARLFDCVSGNFAQSPECWNVAESGRRVWGIGVRQDPKSLESRLYYGVWSSPALANVAWDSLPDDEKRNSVWSVRIAADGSFDPTDVRCSPSAPLRPFEGLHEGRISGSS